MSTPFLSRRILSAALALTMLLPGLAGGAVQAAPTESAPSILLFPFGNNAGANADAVAGRVTDALQLRLSTVGAYKVTVFNSFLPPLQRAMSETPPTLSADDLKAPYDPQKADRLAAQVATDDYLVGAVETYTVDSTTRRVSVTVSADLRDTTSGNSLRTVAYTGTAAPTSSSEGADSVSQRAIDSVAGKIASTINSGHTPRAVVLNSARGHSTAGQTFLLAVLASSLIYAVLHNSTSHDNSNTSVSTGPGGTTGTTTGGTPTPPSPP